MGCILETLIELCIIGAELYFRGDRRQYELEGYHRSRLVVEGKSVS